MAVVQPCVLGTHGGVVETGGDGMRQGHLSVVVLQKIAVSALENPRGTTCETCGMFAQVLAAPTRFHAHELYRSVADESVKHADGVGATTHTRKNRVGKTVFALQNFRPRLIADHTMKIADHHRVRM